MSHQKKTPKGYKWVCVPYRKVKGNSNKILYAKDYGYQAWCFLVKS
ncbi:MAG: hypothetical protein E6369_06385 [Haemophilus parainfluenzae]|jgi:hypothetical protein|nr:hypothetical protein [Haemophilus parainfluenzae]